MLSEKSAVASSAVIILFSMLASPSEGASAVPDLAGFWQHTVAQEEWELPPSGPGPVRRMQGANGSPDPFYKGFSGDYTNPILQPWAAAKVREEGEREARDENALTGQLTCRPSGVPAVFTLLGPVQILQSADQVVFLYQRDHQVRFVYLNTKHSAKLKPSYYGESVGHYEDGALIIDTIGMNDKTWTDRFATPHTSALHVVERYRITNDGKTLQDFFTVEDPGAFTTPWSAVLNYARGQQDALEEEVCAENNRGLPVPFATIDSISGRALPGTPP